MSDARPHDGLFKAVFGRAEGARALLATQLPSDVVAVLDFDTLRVENINAVANHLGQGYADLLFSVSSKESVQQSVLLHLLIEHKSSPERFTVLDLFTRQALILDDWRRKHPRDTHVPLVIPIVLHHGNTPFTAPRELRELFAGGEALKRVLAPLIPSLPIVVIDLREKSDADLDRSGTFDPSAACALWLLKWSRAPDFETRFFAHGDLLRAVLALPHGPREAEPMLRYVFIMMRELLPVADLAKRIADSTSPAAENLVMSLAQRLIDEGIEKGFEKGIEKGMQAGVPLGGRLMVLNVLDARIGPVPDAIRETVDSIHDIEILNSLGRAAAVATSFDEFEVALRAQRRDLRDR